LSRIRNPRSYHEIFYNFENNHYTAIEEDCEFVSTYYDMSDEPITNRISPWLLRIEFDRHMMLDKRYEMQHVVEKIPAGFGNDLNLMSNDDNVERLVLRVRVVNNDETNVQNTKDNTVAQDDEFLKKTEQNMLGEMVLGDVSDIKKVFIKSGKRQQFFDDKGNFNMEKEFGDRRHLPPRRAVRAQSRPHEDIIE
jgi:DNA-directed RNA polymerase II subunit RPB1